LRFNIFLDGKYSLSLAPDVLVQSGIVVGDSLDQKRVNNLKIDDAKFTLMQKALLFLGYRSRSKKEITDRLNKALLKSDFSEEEKKGITDYVQERLVQLGYVDDESFAQALVESGRRKLWGEYRIRQELKKKGIADSLIAAVLPHDSEEELLTAKKAAEKKALSYKGLDSWEQKQKLGAYLARRGYSWETIKGVIDESLSNSR